MRGEKGVSLQQCNAMIWLHEILTAQRLKPLISHGLPGRPGKYIHSYVLTHLYQEYITKSFFSDTQHADTCEMALGMIPLSG